MRVHLNDRITVTLTEAGARQMNALPGNNVGHFQEMAMPFWLMLSIFGRHVTSRPEADATPFVGDTIELDCTDERIGKILVMISSLEPGDGVSRYTEDEPITTVYIEGAISRLQAMTEKRWHPRLDDMLGKLADWIDGHGGFVNSGEHAVEGALRKLIEQQETIDDGRRSCARQLSAAIGRGDSDHWAALLTDVESRTGALAHLAAWIRSSLPDQGELTDVQAERVAVRALEQAVVDKVRLGKLEAQVAEVDRWIGEIVSERGDDERLLDAVMRCAERLRKTAAPVLSSESTVNLNDKVTVELTEQGLRQWKIVEPRNAADNPQPITMQLWRLMHVFGPMMGSPSMHVQPFESNTIKMSRQPLTISNGVRELADQRKTEATTSVGVRMIAAERERQLAKWSREHDREHTGGELAIRAAELAVNHTDASVIDGGDRDYDAWGLVRKHGHDRIRSLVIAGALIAAEIERLAAAPDVPKQRAPRQVEWTGGAVRSKPSSAGTCPTAMPSAAPRERIQQAVSERWGEKAAKVQAADTKPATKHHRLRTLVEDGAWDPSMGRYQTAIGYILPESIPALVSALLDDHDKLVRELAGLWSKLEETQTELGAALEREHERAKQWNSAVDPSTPDGIERARAIRRTVEAWPLNPPAQLVELQQIMVNAGWLPRPSNTVEADPDPEGLFRGFIGKMAAWSDKQKPRVGHQADDNADGLPSILLPTASRDLADMTLHSITLNRICAALTGKPDTDQPFPSHAVPESHEFYVNLARMLIGTLDQVNHALAVAKGYMP